MIKGKIIFEMANVGSKSEGLFPVLLLEDGSKIDVFLDKDHPFEHTIIKQYDGKTVVLDGGYDDNGKFVAVSIEEVADDSSDSNENEASNETVETEGTAESVSDEI